MAQDRSIATERTVLEGALPLAEKIKRARLELLDLSTRNRLLNTPRSGKVRTVEVVNELAAAMYTTLVVEEKRFTFLPGRIETDTAGTGVDQEDPKSETQELSQPDIELD